MDCLSVMAVKEGRIVADVLVLASGAEWRGKER